MSFPRAKIQRFNDVLNSVPSPTKYDPKVGDKVKGGCILKGETRSSALSDTASASSKTCVTPVFRTPQLPRRHNCLGTGTSEKENHSAFKSISLKHEDLEFLGQDAESEELKALRVECANKTETINDMEKHIQELKTEICDHEKAKTKLEIYVAELETAKSNLECIRDNETCEQIIKLKEEIIEYKSKIEEFSKQKEEALVKLEEAEKKNNKLEEFNLDFERKIISLEGTIEQLEMEQKNKEKLLADLRQKEEVYKMNHQVSIECLKGKISTLENEIKEMDSNKSKNEATIFGLETEISKLNGNIEKLRSEKLETEKLLKETSSMLGEMEGSTKTHTATITGLEMELETRVKELKQLKDDNVTLKTELENLESKMEEQKGSFEADLKILEDNHKTEMQELDKKYNELESLLDSESKNFEEQMATLRSSHAEEVLQLQNDYESKLLAQMQENTDKINLLQCQLDEKDVFLKQANAKFSKISAEWEKKLLDTEDKFGLLINKLESDRLENLEEVKRSYSKKIEKLEMSSLKALDVKNKEIDMLTEQYREILGEVKELIVDMEQKDQEIHKISGVNHNLNSRLKLMLEEIKLLNKENEKTTESLNRMTIKYHEEFSKNEQLSLKLGELDCKISQLKGDLNKKVEEWKRVSEDLKKSKSSCDKLQNKKLDLEGTVNDLQEKISKLIKELNDRKAVHEEEIVRVNEELATVKSQCRKFEIAMGNTGKSLEAVRKRLIESENEVEKLAKDNVQLQTMVGKIEGEKEDFEAKFHEMLETKLGLEIAIDEYLANNKELSGKCANLESLCDEFEIKIKELTRLNGDLEMEKQNNIKAMNDLFRKQELDLIETERAALDSVEKVSQVLTEKLEFFMKFSTEKVQNLTSELKTVKGENRELAKSLKSKMDDHDNLVTDNEILKTTVEIAVKESENLKKRCEEQYVELKTMEDSIIELRSQKENLESMLVEKEKENSNMVQQSESFKAQWMESVAEIKHLKTSKSELENQVEIITSKCNEENKRAESKEEEMKDLVKAITQLELKIRGKDTEIASCQEEKIICLQEIQSLTAEKEKLLVDINKTEREMAEREKLIKELQEMTVKADEDHKNCEADLNKLIIEKGKMEAELQAVKEEYEKLKEKAATLDEVEERKNYYKSSCLKLDKLCSELTEENATVKNDFNEIHSLLQEKDKKLEELQKRCSDLESLIGPFREQLEQYENERLFIENDREQLRKQHLEQAAKLGHQNHKQKIQHVVNLKNNLLKTRKENEKLTLELKNMKKKLQKLQEELGQDPKRLFIGGKRPSSTPFKGKENNTLLTPSAGLITPMTIKQEAMSPSSPLRNRNQ